MSRSGKFHALLATARVANIPSVVSNVWVGVAMALIGRVSEGPGAEVPWLVFIPLSIAGVALYVSGNFLNDWMDRGWDAVKRPERALPTGKFSPSAYLAAGLFLAGLGIAVAGSVNDSAALVACVIFGCVAVYTWSHKKTILAVVPMGLCRALLPVMGAAGLMEWSDKFPKFPGVALFAYITGLSLAARFESSNSLPGNVRWVARNLFLVPPALVIFVHLKSSYSMMLVGIVPYILWVAFCDLARRAKIVRFVSFLLAGIPLVDWVFLLPLGLSETSGAFMMTCLALPPLALVSALLLQRLAPAT